MNIIVICLIVTVCIVYILDYVDFPHNLVARIMSRLMHKKVIASDIILPKVLECSLCCSTWLTLIILLIYNWHLAPLCLVYGFLSKHINSAIVIINKILEITLYKINSFLDKISNN